MLPRVVPSRGVAARRGTPAGGLPDQDPVRTHPQRLLDQTTDLDLTGVLELGLPGLHRHPGSGIFSDFRYLGRTSPPSAEKQDQEQAHVELFQAVHGAKVVLRTLDAGADKPLPFLDMEAEDNPAPGVRGLRVSRRRPEVLATQLTAVARAAESTGADVWVRAPMLSTVGEVADFAEQVHALGLARAGVMVYVPAAALQAARLLEVVDFLSVGTNDLSQYALAADRMNGDLADLLVPWQPALLQLLAMCGATGRDAGTSVSRLRRGRGRPAPGPVLLGMGITSLSMSAPSVPAVRAALASRTHAECVDLAGVALAAVDTASARAAVAERCRG